MKKGAKIVEIAGVTCRDEDCGKPEKNSLSLNSGGRVTVLREAGADTVRIVNPGGKLLLSVRVDEQGATVAIEGERIEIAAEKTLSLSAPHVELRAKESLDVLSSGTLGITAEKEMKVHSVDDVRVTGKIIHLN